MVNKLNCFFFSFEEQYFCVSHKKRWKNFEVVFFEKKIEGIEIKFITNSIKLSTKFIYYYFLFVFNLQQQKLIYFIKPAAPHILAFSISFNLHTYLIAIYIFPKYVRKSYCYCHQSYLILFSLWLGEQKRSLTQRFFCITHIITLAVSKGIMPNWKRLQFRFFFIYPRWVRVVLS